MSLAVQTRRQRFARPARVTRRSNLVPRVALVVGLLAMWELLVRTGVLPASGFVPLRGITSALGDQVTTGAFWTALKDSLTSWLVGLAICIAIGVPFGALLGWRDGIYRSVRLVLEFLRSTPPVVLIPFVLLFLGPSQEMKICLVVLGGVWPILIQSMYGVHGVEGTLVHTARAYRIRGLRFFNSILMPTISPYLVTGARVSAVLALLLTIGSEMVTSAPGLGRAIFDAQTNNDLAGMYALIVVAGVIGLLVNTVFSVIERRVLSWHPSQRSPAA
jgi:ABC-type nitrate/sulfonate/bicarbonate transport system permease component